MSSGDDLATEYADTMVGSIADIMARYDGMAHDGEGEHTCEHCDRAIVQDDDGRWVDPEATGGDSVWRETCDANDTFDAVHEPDACECQERASDELIESYALELVAEKGEPFSVLLTYGGPTAWIEWSGRRGTDSAELRVTWSSDVVVRRSTAIREMAAYYAEMMEPGD